MLDSPSTGSLSERANSGNLTHKHLRFFTIAKQSYANKRDKYLNEFGMFRLNPLSFVPTQTRDCKFGGFIRNTVFRLI